MSMIASGVDLERIELVQYVLATISADGGGIAEEKTGLCPGGSSPTFLWGD
jgi:hypothetical protein